MEAVSIWRMAFKVVDQVEEQEVVSKRTSRVPRVRGVREKYIHTRTEVLGAHGAFREQ